MNRISNERIVKEINELFEVNGIGSEDIEKILIHVMVLDNGMMGASLHLDDIYLDFGNEDLIFTDSVVELQKEIKEIGQLIYKKYEIVADVEFSLFEGLRLDLVFAE